MKVSYKLLAISHYITKTIIILSIMVIAGMVIYCGIKESFIPTKRYKEEAIKLIYNTYNDSHNKVTNINIQKFEYEEEDGDYEMDITFRYENKTRLVEVDCQCLCLPFSENDIVCRIDRW